MASEAMDWDSELGEQEAAEQKKNSDFELLPDGDYHFKVMKLEKDRFTAGPQSKIPSCPVAIVHLLVKAEDGKANYFRENLYLYDENKWKLLQFFTCIGLRKHGDGKTKMPWNEVEGCEGRAKLGHRVNKKDSTKVYNCVQKWYDPEPPKEEATASDGDDY